MPNPTSRPFPMGEREFIVLMALFQALQALAIDVMLPALGVISKDLGVSDPNDRQLVIGIFLLSSGLGSLFPGTLADRFGRKPVLFACLGAYTAISLSCALVRDFTALLALRALQGFFTSGMAVMPMTIIRDRFSGDRMARAQSLVAMTFMIVPMLAPTIGQAILMVAGWRWIFGVMALMAAIATCWTWLRLPETLRPEFRQPVRPRAIVANMRSVLRSREALGYFLGAACIQAALFGYINSSQQLVAEHFGAGELFPLIFGAMAFIMSGANFVNARIVEHFGSRRVSQAALFAYIGIAALHLAIAFSGQETLWHFATLVTLNMLLMAFIAANFQAIALQPFARIAGAAASAQTFVRMVIAATVGAAIGRAYDGTAVPMAGAMTVAGLIALALVLFSEKGELFRRLHYPDAH